MPCAATHRLVNMTATAAFLAAHKPGPDNHALPHPAVGATLSATLATLPDLIEPAVHPHHRQFFHSLVFAGLVGYGIHKAYHWQPQTQLHEIIRLAVLLGGSAYLLHLAADFMTARSLPFIGK